MLGCVWLGCLAGLGLSLTSGYVNVAITTSEPTMQLESRQNQFNIVRLLGCGA